MSGNSGKTAIVFGGAGFIGQHMIQKLLATGEYARIVSADFRSPSDRIAGVEYVSQNVHEPISIAGGFGEPEIYNFVAVHTTPGHEDWEYFWTNVWGALHVCAFADRINCKLIVFTSSISVYGPTEEPFDEDSPKRPESAYGMSKLQAEEIHRQWRRAAPERRLVIVRPAVIFGHGEHGNYTRMADLLKRGRFVYPGRSDTIKSAAYVGELVQSIGYMCGVCTGEIIYNMAYPKRYTTKDICQAFATVAGYKMPRLTVPISLMLAAGFGFEILAALGLKTSINRARVLKLYRSTNVAPGVLTRLGYRFETDFEEGLRRWRQESPSGEFG